MESKHQAQLEQARAHFYSQRIVECYGILRRYFDRLPFEPEEGHCEYIAMFCRVLAELGKSFELNFYIKELEKLQSKNADENTSYALAVAYIYSDKPSAETAKKLLESSIKSPCLRLQAKSKMMLAHLYSLKSDYTSAEAIISSIKLTSDERLNRLAQIWKANVLRATGNPHEAMSILQPMLEEVSEEEDWYAFFSVRNIYALTLCSLGKHEEAGKVIDSLHSFVESRNFRSTREQLKSAEEQIRKLGPVQHVVFENSGFKPALIYNNRKIFLDLSSAIEKLLITFLRKSFVSKAQIIKSVYGRPPREGDEKLIYYQIHTLRQRLKEFELPAESIRTEADGYRFIHDVEFTGDET